MSCFMYMLVYNFDILLCIWLTVLKFLEIRIHVHEHLYLHIDRKFTLQISPDLIKRFKKLDRS